MKKLSLPAALLVAFGWMMLFASPAPAHPGVEGVVLECEDCEDDDEARFDAGAAEDKEVVDGES